MALVISLSAAALLACDDSEPKTLCERTCDNVARSGCPGVQPAAVCVQGCEELVAADPACTDEANAYVNCVATAGFTCEAGTGDPVPVGCDAEEAALQSCWGVPAGTPPATSASR